MLYRLLFALRQYVSHIICQTLRPYKLSPFVCQSGNKSYRLADRIADGRYVIAGGPVGIS